MSIRRQSASSTEASSDHPGTANADASRSNDLATADVTDSAAALSILISEEEILEAEISITEKWAKRDVNIKLNEHGNEFIVSQSFLEKPLSSRSGKVYYLFKHGHGIPSSQKEQHRPFIAAGFPLTSFIVNDWRYRLAPGPAPRGFPSLEEAIIGCRAEGFTEILVRWDMSVPRAQLMRWRTSP